VPEAHLTDLSKTSNPSKTCKSSSVNRDLIFKALAEATNDARKAITAAWPEIVASVTRPADRALLNNTEPKAAGEQFVVVTFPHENLAKRVMENADLQLTFGNLLSSICGFSPEIIALAENDWQEIRAEYVASLKAENSQEQIEVQSEPIDESLRFAKELFGDKVVEIND
jgi:DNA polymerase-3 subunit gamma/tau